MKKLVLGFVVCALMAAPALANITILKDYPGAPSTYTVYDFTTGENHVGHSFSIPYDVWQTNIVGIGTPTNADVTLTGPGSGWYDGGTILPDYIHGDTYAQIVFTIPNLEIPDKFKLIQVETVYQLGVGATDGLNNGVLTVPGNQSIVQYPVVRDLGNGWYDLTWTWKVWPQPPWETITIGLSSTYGINVDSVEVATVCIPAPAAVILGSIGTVLVGWLRRRRCL